MKNFYCDRCSKRAETLAHVLLYDAIRKPPQTRQRVDAQLCDSCVNGLNYWLHHPAPWLRPEGKKSRRRASTMQGL